MAKDLSNLKVAILVADGFEQQEMTDPRKALDDAGAKTFIVSPVAGEVQGWNHYEHADKFPVEFLLDESNAADFDALLLPGGVANPDQLRINPKAVQFVREFFDAGKPVAVICHGPWLLASAKLVSGRKMTSYHTIQDDLRNAGADWQDVEVLRDRNWVSSRKPADLPAFNREMLALFGEHQAARTAKAA